MKKKLLVFAALLVLALAVTSIALATDVPENAKVTVDELGNITSINQHPVVDYVIIKHETCTDEGSARFQVNLGTEDTTTYYITIKPHGHTMSSTAAPDNNDWGRVTEPATCTTPGKAIDVCVCPYEYCDCKYEDPDTYRIIVTNHEYDMTPQAYVNGHADLIKEPSCKADGEGQAWRTCLVCGTRMPENDQGTHLVVVDKIPHDWSDWREDKASTCSTYGKAARTCVRCSYVQYLDEGHPVYDQGEQVTIDTVLPLLNKEWNNVFHSPYNSQLDLEGDMEAAALLLDDFEVTKNWLKDCYTRQITVHCPYCNGNVHPDIVLDLVYPATAAHDYVLAPDGEGIVEWESLAPTCLNPGYYLYICKYFDTGTEEHTPDAPEGDECWYRVDRPALDHDWSEWYPSDMFEKEEEGQFYLVSFRVCNNCGATEQKTEPYVDPDMKQGLVKDDDGVWRYYIDGEVATNVTKLVPFQGGEFWVINGVVPPEANGLVICPDGAYFLVAGQVQRVTQWAEYNGEWFIIKNGELDKVTGLMDYNGGTFAVCDGRKMNELNGLWCDPATGKWAFIAGGQVATWFTGETTYDGHTFQVVKGYLAN